MSRKFELKIRVDENSPIMTSEYSNIGSLVRDFNSVKIGGFYEVFITEVNENGETIRRIITLNNGHTSMSDEWCSECETEVVLPSRFEAYKCPECGNQILPCNLCYYNVECSKCPLMSDEFNFVELL